MAYFWSLLSILICPLGMGLMMWFMMRRPTSDHEHNATPSTRAGATRPSILHSLHLCINWSVIVALVLIGLGIWAIAPGLVWGALPLLALAACPLSMLVMAWSMRGKHHTEAPLVELRTQQAMLDRAVAELKMTHASANDANAPDTTEIATHV